MEGNEFRLPQQKEKDKDSYNVQELDDCIEVESTSLGHISEKITWVIENVVPQTKKPVVLKFNHLKITIEQ